MSDFLGRLAQRVVAPQTLLQARAASLFESAPAPPMPVETAGIDAVVPPREIAAAATAPAQPARAVESPRPIEPATGVGEAEAPEERVPIAHVAAETRRENAEPMPTVIPRNVVERIPIEAAADAALAPPAPATPHPSAPPPAPRVITHRAAPLAAKENEIAPAAERDVHITIGRIDVRAVTPQPRERQAAKTPRALTLDEYLAQRSRR